MDRKEGIGRDYLWEEEEDAIPAPILQFWPICVLRLEREREGHGGARVGRGKEEERKKGTACERGWGRIVISTLAPASGALRWPLAPGATLCIARCDNWE